MKSQLITPANLFLGLTSIAPCCEVAETFQSTLIIGNEQAIEDGLPPMNALASILSWVAEEVGRLSAEARTDSLTTQLPEFPLSAILSLAEMPDEDAANLVPVLA
jgi:hypothetical protein